MTEDTVVARWRKPATVMAVSTDVNRTSSDAGRPQLGVSIRLHPDDVERVRQGYLCLKCLEPSQERFPEKCKVCGYAMKLYQAEDFAKTYGGVERNPRAVLIESELEKLDDKHERNFWAPKPTIIVPSWAKSVEGDR